MLFHPAWLFVFHMSQENLLMAVKCKEGQVMEAWVFFLYKHFPGYLGPWVSMVCVDGSKSWEIRVL